MDKKQLEKWWKKHQAEAARLTPEDKERLVTHCGTEKLLEILIKGG